MSNSMEFETGAVAGRGRSGGGPKLQSAFIPLTLLSVAFLTMIVYQITLTNTRHDLMTKQLDMLNQQAEQGAQLAAQVKGIYADLQALSKTDPQAQAILQRFFPQNMQQNAGGGQQQKPTVNP